MRRQFRVASIPLASNLALVAALALSPVVAACADIHSAPDEPVEGMLEAPTDEADQFRRAEERAAEDREEGGERRR